MPIQEVLTVFSLALLVVPLNAQGKKHPLDPLTWQEYWTTQIKGKQSEFGGDCLCRICAENNRE